MPSDLILMLFIGGIKIDENMIKNKMVYAIS